MHRITIVVSEAVKIRCLSVRVCVCVWVRRQSKTETKWLKVRKGSPSFVLYHPLQFHICIVIFIRLFLPLYSLVSSFCSLSSVHFFFFLLFSRLDFLVLFYCLHHLLISTYTQFCCWCPRMNWSAFEIVRSTSGEKMRFAVHSLHSVNRGQLHSGIFTQLFITNA